MIFLHPIWFLALTAISIPVTIHLWNIRKGKTLKIGSIALITAASRKRSLSRRLNDVLLLLLRCLFLILLAFILTIPLWRRNSNSSKIKGWVLISKESVNEAYQKFKPKIDSLTKAGFEFHYFNKGFAKADINKALSDTVHYHNTDASYWTLIQQLNGQTQSVYIFTSSRAIHFTGEKPQVSLKLHWQTYRSADSASKWIAKAWLTNNNDIQVVEGNSNPNGTSYKNYTIRSGDQSVDFAVHSENGKLSVGLKNSKEQMAVDTSTWQFAIYTDKNIPDAGYLKAALQSIIQFTKHKAVVKQFADVSQIQSKQNWLFWLSTKPVAKQLQYDNFFTYESGKINHSNSRIIADDSFGQNIELYKSIIANDKGFVLWKEDFGNPVLTLESQSGKNLYHFYNRFDPAWNDLVWSSEFPKMLLKLIVGPSAEPNAGYDKRTLSDEQIMPVITDEHAAPGKASDHIDLSRYIWLLLMLIFFAERWFVHKSKSKSIVQNG